MFSHRPSDYAVQRWGSKWRVHKFCGLHGRWIGFYEVTISRDEAGDYMGCTCQGARNCKHCMMVLDNVLEGRQPATTGGSSAGKVR